MTPKYVANKEASQVSKTGPNGMIIRGMTFYKSELDPMVADDGEPGENSECKPSVSFKGSSRERTSQLWMDNHITVLDVRTLKDITKT